MQQQFHTRNYSVRDFEDWNDRGELELAPKFQRRDVWSPLARSFLIDTILCGKPIPKIYMRQAVNPKTRRAHREIVDGQQRLRTVLTYLKDAFPISKSHGKGFAGKRFSEIPSKVQGEILKYEFVVDLLQDMEDSEVYDVFARINTYAEKLKPQELRNARFSGDFKTAVYDLAKVVTVFFGNNKIFSAKQLLRMAEAEFISELLLAMEEGIREGGKKKAIDDAYKKYDPKFPSRPTHEKRFIETIDTIGAIAGPNLVNLEFRALRLFYPLFCAVYHIKFGLKRLEIARPTLRVSDYAKCSAALEAISERVAKVNEGGTAPARQASNSF